jgi:hypothetical protein
MFKRFIARVLIAFQIYGTIFQGVIHANFIDSYPVRDEIHLHGSLSKDGGLRLSLHTNKEAELEKLDETDVLSYEHLEVVQASGTTPKELTSESEGKKVELKIELERLGEINVPSYEDLGEKYGAASEEEEAEVVGFKTDDGIVRLPDGIHFTLQGLDIFMSNEGHLLVQGSQTDFTKPIFLSAEKGIVLHNVQASAMKLDSSSVFAIGQSSIDFLALEGLEVDGKVATFTNTGSLTTKEVFLKNLDSTNKGYLKAGNIGTIGETFTFVNEGTIEGGNHSFAGSSFLQNGMIKSKSLKAAAHTTVTTSSSQVLELQEFIGASTSPWKLQGVVKTGHFKYAGDLDVVRGAQLLATQKSALKALTVAEGAQTILHNLELNGAAVQNAGHFFVMGTDLGAGGLSLTNTGTAHVDGAQIMPSVTADDSENLARIVTGVATDPEFINPEFVELNEEEAKTRGTYYKNLLMKTRGAIDPEFVDLSEGESKLRATAYKQQFIDRMRGIPLDDLEGQLRTARTGRLSVADITERRDQVRTIARRLEELTQHFLPERQLLEEFPGFEGIRDRILSIALEPIRLEYQSKKEELSQLPEEKHRIQQQLIEDVFLKYRIRKLEQQIPAYKALTPEILQIKLRLSNQSTGKLVLKSGSFDLSGDQAFVNDGLLVQDHAHMQWTSPSSWSTAGEFNRGRWEVEGGLKLLGNTGENLGALSVKEGAMDVVSQKPLRLHNPIQTER